MGLRAVLSGVVGYFAAVKPGHAYAVRLRVKSEGRGLAGLSVGWKTAAHLAAAQKRQAGALRDFAAAGGRVVVLAATTWDWPELCEVKVGGTRGSRVFAYPEGKHPMLAGIQPEWLMRWNGLPGAVAAGSLESPALATAEKILWLREPKVTVAAEVPAAGGKGTILFLQLGVQGRLDRSKPGYDPVAERVLVNMLQETSG